MKKTKTGEITYDLDMYGNRIRRFVYNTKDGWVQDESFVAEKGTSRIKYRR